MQVILSLHRYIFKKFVSFRYFSIQKHGAQKLRHDLHDLHDLHFFILLYQYFTIQTPHFLLYKYSSASASRASHTFKKILFNFFLRNYPYSGSISSSFSKELKLRLARLARLAPHNTKHIFAIILPFFISIKIY